MANPGLGPHRQSGKSGGVGLGLRETEASFQTWVIDQAHLTGWLVVHFRPGQTARGWRTPVEADGAGWPDLILCRPPRLIIAELKGPRGKVTIEQAGWLGRLSACPGIEAFAWWPDDRADIADVLR